MLLDVRTAGAQRVVQRVGLLIGPECSDSAVDPKPEPGSLHGRLHFSVKESSVGINALSRLSSWLDGRWRNPGFGLLLNFSDRLNPLS